MRVDRIQGKQTALVLMSHAGYDPREAIDYLARADLQADEKLMQENKRFESLGSNTREL